MRAQWNGSSILAGNPAMGKLAIHGYNSSNIVRLSSNGNEIKTNADSKATPSTDLID